MTSDLLQYLAFIVLCFSLGYVYFSPRIHCHNSASKSKCLLTAIKSILQPRDTQLRQILEERAHANQRLVRALNLSNTFVSGDEIVHKEFVSQAQRLLNNAQRKGWSHFQSVARNAVQWQLKSCKGPCYEFHTTIQNITLFVVLVGLLGIDTEPADISYDDVSVVTNHITRLWALSKSRKAIPPVLLVQLNSSLRRLTPNADVLPAPLDFIVPAWETMWRVVATTTAYAGNSLDAQRAFTLFNACPKAETFRQDVQGNGATVKNIVTEAMRLHPPSRRISRSVTFKWCPTFLQRWAPRTLIKADIEALLVNRDLWGDNCFDFIPRRHSPGTLLLEQQEAMPFAFGHGPLRCIASSWAPIAAAVVVGAILEEYIVMSGGNIGGREGWKGWKLNVEH